jgi:uncharacterized protein YndB with AHSA1/START domain
MKAEILVVVKEYEAPLEKVWQALTDKVKMREWYFDVDDFKPEPGFEFHFKGQNEGREFLHICIVKEAILNSKLKHSWRYENYSGESYVTFEFIPEGHKTRLILTHEGLETFPQDNPDFAVKNFNFGWNHILGIALPEYLDKN